MRLTRHPLLNTLLGLKGNPRACVYTEPLWGIPFHLFIPFATLYMYQLGVGDQQIGIIMTVGMVFQIIAAVFGTILVDKLGRRLSTVIFDTLGWSVPVLIWMLAQNFWWFIAAAALNGMMQVTAVSWNCLMVEDAERSKLVDMYTWCTIAGLLAVFFAPLAGILVREISLVPAMRILYGFAFIMMTTKFVVLYFWSHETRQGMIRMKETRGVPYGEMLGQYRGVLRQILHTPATMQILAVIVILNITNVVTGSFMALFATRNAGVPDWLIAYFPIVRAAVMLLFIFGLQHRFNKFPIKGPMVVGLGLYLAAISFLLLSPSAGQGLLIGYILLDAFAFALVVPRRDSLLVLYVDPHERARITGILLVLMLAVSSPFGTIAGWLSSMHRSLPFLMNAGLYVLCAVILLCSRPVVEQEGAEQADIPAVAGSAGETL